jgi:2-hydroxychromene-2-carboxylate isomerase
VSLTYWFDVHSPWCYLAAYRIGDLARRHQLDLDWRPLHLPRLLQAIDGVKPLESTPARVRWFRQDIIDWADLQNMPLTFHRDYPLRNSRVLRACLLAGDHGRAEAFACRVLKGYWAEQGDISDLGQIAAWAADVGLDGEAAVAAAQSEEMKQRLEANTDEAIARGIFGVPMVDTGSKLYFGNDRLDLLDHHLRQGRL